MQLDGFVRVEGNENNPVMASGAEKMVKSKLAPVLGSSFIGKSLYREVDVEGCRDSFHRITAVLLFE